MSIKVKLVIKMVVPLVIGLLIIGMVQTYLIQRFETDGITEVRAGNEQAIQAKLKSHIDLAFSMLESMKKSGADQETCLSTLESVRFGENGYLWVHSYDPAKPDHPKMVMHPLKSSQKGKDLYGLVDWERCNSIYYEGQIYQVGAPEIAHLSETRIYAAMNQKCKEAGEGLVRYFAPKAKNGAAETSEGYPILSYVKLMSDWGWVIGVEEYADALDRIVAMDRARIETQGASLLYFWISGSVGLFLLLGVLSWLHGQSLTRAIQSARKMTEKIAAGDLSRRLHLKRSDEIGLMAGALDRMAENLEGRTKTVGAVASGDLNQKIDVCSEYDNLGLALQTLTQGLNDIIGQISQAAGRVTNGSHQVSDSSQALSQGATEQASSLVEITSSMNVLNSQTRTNAENASQANSHALSVRDSADKGANHMQGMVTAMAEINESSQQISRIIKVIDDIAFQTNLLALNAAVEAARAGRHGKGFAVVAEEVRNLAARSAKAAQETGELIEGSAKKVHQGSEIANRTEEALKEIVEGVTRVTDLVGEIASASNEQAMGIGQVNEGLSQIDSVTQQNTATAEETASAAQVLSSQAMQLKHLLTRFKLCSSEPVAQQVEEADRAPAPAPVMPSEPSHAEPMTQQPVEAMMPAQHAEDRHAEVPEINDHGGWGDTQSNGDTQSKKENDEVAFIALDDNEFGRY